jgi:hypothetical protein
MRAARLIAAAFLALGGCASSASVVSRTETGLTLRWDERDTSPARVAAQAIDLCSGFGHGARRAFVIADDREGPVHTTRYACRGARTGGLNLP